MGELVAGGQFIGYNKCNSFENRAGYHIGMDSESKSKEAKIRDLKEQIELVYISKTLN
jgi:hypothetical protein